MPLSVALHTTKKMQTSPGSPLRSELAFSIWLSPKSSMTLEDAAKLIENFAAGQVSRQLALRDDPVVNYNYQGVVCSMTFQGQDIQRTQMTNCSAKDYMREGEPFNLIFTQTYRATVNRMVLFCRVVLGVVALKLELISDSP